MLSDVIQHYDCHPKTMRMEDGRYFAYVEVFLDGVQLHTGEFGKAGFYSTQEEAKRASIRLCKLVSEHYNSAQ